MPFIPAKDAVKTMSDYVNNMGHSPKEFVEAMSNEHRTLQQSFTGVCLAWLKHLSTLDPDKGIGVDGRNEYSVKIAKKLLKDVDDWELHTPLI